MKKTFITIAMMATATWFAPNANAQGGAKSIPASFKIPSEDIRVGGGSPDVAELAKRTQVSLYNGANSVTWEKLANNRVVSNFTLNDVRHRAVYDSRGNWRWTEKSYSGETLSQGIRNMIFSDYGEVSIKWVDEITMPDSSPNYFVVISDKKVTRRIRVVEDKIETMEEFVNQ